jgi:TRAP-type C4-dicarboxylate transport system permease small subunit
VQRLAAFILMLIRLLLGAMLLASVALICANAFGRYVLLAPIIWAEEVLSYALVWMVYLGAVQVTSDRGHLRMDLVVQGLPWRWRRAAGLIGDLVFLAVGGLIIYQANDSIRQFTHHSLIAQLPMDVLHTVIPVSFALMVVLVVMHAIADLRGAGDAPSRTVP